MRVTSVPLRLRLASGFLLLSIPLAAFQVILTSGAPVWNLPRERIGVAALLATFLFLPLVHWLNSGRIWALWLTALTAGSWFLVSLVSALHLVSFWMAIFVTFLGAYWILAWWWLKLEMEKSYFDPRVRWYHGAPEAIAGLTASASDENAEGANGNGEFRVCRFDHDGAFLFRPEGFRADGEETGKPGKRIRAVFKFRGAEVEVEGSVIRTMGKNEGFGIRFETDAPDLRKELGDFIERLRGEGYV